MKKKVFGLAFLFLAGVLPASDLFAIQNCGNQDFNGAYGVLASGAVTLPGFPITGPFARAGQVRADGHGNVVFNTTASYNGILFNELITGSYAVSPDCSVVFHIQPFAPVFLPATFDALLADNKRELTFMIVDPPGQTIHAVLRKQDAGASDAGQGGCNARNLSKAYELTLQGNVLSPASGELSGEFVRVGKFIPDGNGNFTAETHANYDGFKIQAENFSGTYTVAKNCTVSVQYTFEGVPYAWSGALTDNSNRADLIVSAAAGNPGVYVISGTLQQQ